MSSQTTSNEVQVAKKKALEATFAQIDKQYGKGSVMLLGQATNAHVEVISSGSILLDHALGVNGIPRGRIIEIYGPEASGKTTLALHALAQAQQNGGICAFIDAEHALDPAHVTKLGVKIDDLIISQPDFGEQALDIAEMLIRSGAIDLIVIDSVAALVPKAELEGEMGDAHVGLQARLMSQALRKLTPIVHKSKTILIFINQIRQNISSFAFANKETTTGGNALKFYASLRLDVRRIASLKKGELHIGNRVAIKVAKNKVAPPFKRVELDLLFEEGISKELDLLDAALHCEIIKKSGAWFSYENENIAQGREQTLQFLKENKETCLSIKKQVLEKLQEKTD
ncbi:TPA: recombinase RecA [Candidatus Dependentiae bacterium]|nr:MAG: Protein RecA [candidate division TM6 bacterium GW2011_GWF2_36_131]KKQ03184.1 MAG: Protein RecA [candidate division TM6 bacterium GW2011_GWE2_36_25]HBR70386.1 recombinase RecA [Candidatus Dependentiae bacterium]HCU00931.1 recombinase RecA [Candidatus Dependentiae bacterium]